MSSDANQLSDKESSDTEAPVATIRDKTKDLNAFFHPSEKVGSKSCRACKIFKDVYISICLHFFKLTDCHRSQGSI